MKDDFKYENIHIRISPRDKEIIKSYVSRKGIKLSDFIRDTCLAEIKGQNNDGNSSESKDNNH